MLTGLGQHQTEREMSCAFGTVKGGFRSARGRAGQRKCFPDKPIIQRLPCFPFPPNHPANANLLSNQTMGGVSRSVHDRQINRESQYEMN